MPTNDLDRLRAAVDQLANALQPAALVSGRLRRLATEAAEDATAVDEALRPDDHRKEGSSCFDQRLDDDTVVYDVPSEPLIESPEIWIVASEGLRS